jgi:CCR4-NOT transcription complex subunit 6
MVDLKVLQAHHLLQEVSTFLIQNSPTGLNTPLIIAGDFNSLPNSSVYEFFKYGSVDKSRVGLQKDLRHPFELASAFETVGEPVSIFTPGFAEYFIPHSIH